MTEPTSRDKSAAEGLGAERGEELPEREAMSLIAANLAGSGTAAAALTVLSADSTAVTDTRARDPEQ